MESPNVTKLIAQKKVLIFDLEDVLFPVKDFVLQVYYMFAQFVEYAEAKPIAKEMTDWMASVFEEEGEEGMFLKVANRFDLSMEYEESFDRLHHKVQLPLKLVVEPKMLKMIHAAHAEGKNILILTAGDPLMQLNKIKQVEWEGLQSVLQLYFEDELRFKNYKPFEFIAEELQLPTADFLYIGLENSRAWRDAMNLQMAAIEIDEI